MSLMWVAAVVSAFGAEVVWLDPGASPEDVAAVAVAAGAAGAPRTADALRAAATDVQPSDRQAWDALAAALRDVRPLEQQLDGELLIMKQLERPIASIGILPDAEARDRLFGALAYQGFAVDRFFLDGLGSDARAESWAAALPDGRAVPRPWLDAIALAPERAVTPYEIAEATQRARFGEAKSAASTLLPGLLVIDGPLPSGSSLVVDGVAAAPGPSGQLQLRPGRHLIHVAKGDHVLARFDVRLEPAGETSVSVPLSDATWDAWLASVRSGAAGAPPEPVAASVAAWGGEVVVAWRGARGPAAATVTAEGVVPLDLSAPRKASSRGGAGGGAVEGTEVQVAAGVGGGWMSSADFYLQDPANVPRTRASVNAGALDVVLDVSVQTGLFRASVIGDLAVTLGEDHVAFTGDRTTRLRPDLSVGLGVTWAQVTAGFLFPYHPSVGARATIPVFDGLEVLATGRVGLPVGVGRDDGSVYQTRPVYQLWAGIGYRFGVRVGK